MLTIFTLPKPFSGRIGSLQRNAIRSWKQLGSDCQIILCGDTPDLDAVAGELAVDRVSEIACNQFGTPFVSSAFRRVAEYARNDVLCYANADIIFLPDFLVAVKAVLSMQPRFLIVGECWDVDVEEGLVEEDGPGSDEEWEATLRQRVSTAGLLRGPEAMDFFVFRRGTIGPLPDFVVGRPGWDNWMIWHALSLDMPVVDISPSALVAHQRHDYMHVPSGRGSRWEGPEADANRTLLSFRQNLFSLHFATHRLVGSQLVPNRTGGIPRRLPVTLLQREWTVPIYRMLRFSYRMMSGQRQHRP